MDWAGSAINPRAVVSGIRSQATKLRTTPKVILEGSRKIGTKAVEVTAKVSERAKQGLRIAKTFTRDFSSRIGRRSSSRQQPRVETVDSLVADFQSRAAEIVARRQAELPSNPSFGGDGFPKYQAFGLATNEVLKQFGHSIDDLTNAASQPFKNTALTKAARALDKHAAGQRTSGTFPQLRGNSVVRNEQARQIVVDILNDPDSKFKILGRGGLEIRSLNGQGIRFNKDGSFSGFVD